MCPVHLSREITLLRDLSTSHGSLKVIHEADFLQPEAPRHGSFCSRRRVAIDVTINPLLQQAQ